MPYYFRAIAVDYDGTLTEGATPAPDVLAAVADIRAYGRKVILCTSRILSEWRADWPAVVDPFDAIVAENGSVIARAENPERATTTAVPAELAAALRKRRVPLRVLERAPRRRAPARVEKNRAGDRAYAYGVHRDLGGVTKGDLATIAEGGR